MGVKDKTTYWHECSDKNLIRKYFKLIAADWDGAFFVLTDTACFQLFKGNLKRSQKNKDKSIFAEIFLLVFKQHKTNQRFEIFFANYKERCTRKSKKHLNIQMHKFILFTTKVHELELFLLVNTLTFKATY